MRLLAVLVASLIAGDALAQANTAPGCRLLSEGNGTKVWQCAPTPATDSSSNVGPEDKK